MREFDKVGGPIIAVGLVIFTGYMIYVGYRFHRHYGFSVGTVTDVTPSGYKGAGDYSIIFSFIVDGKEYSGSNSRAFCANLDRSKIKDLLKDKKFPVVYAIETPSLGFMVLSQEYANKFKYTLPDSVRYYDSVLTCK